MFPSLKPLGPHASLPPIPINRPVTMIGSRRTARIHLGSTRVSKAHALIVVTPAMAYICDLLSREGTRVKGHAIRELELRDGDELQLGDFKFQYSDPRPRQKSAPPDVEPLALQITTPSGSRRVVLEKRVTLIGRRAGSDIELHFPDVSTANTAIVRLDGFAGEGASMAFTGWGLFDLGGKGTELNGHPVHKAQIHPGDVLKIGRATLEVFSLLQEATSKRSRYIEPTAATQQPLEVLPPAPEPVVAAPVAAEEPVTHDDLDAIRLDEDLTPDGLDLDVLGGSHVMEAITEPSQPPPASVEVPVDAADTAHLPEVSLEELLDLPENEQHYPQTTAHAPESHPGEPEAERQEPALPDSYASYVEEPAPEAAAEFDEPDVLGAAETAPDRRYDDLPPAVATSGEEQPLSVQTTSEDVDLSQVDFDSGADGVGAGHATAWQAVAADEPESPSARPVAEFDGADPSDFYEQAQVDRPVPAHSEWAETIASEAEWSTADQGSQGTALQAERAWADAAAGIELDEAGDLTAGAVDDDVASEPPQLGIREGELDLRDPSAEDVPQTAELVITETEPTPQSALDMTTLEEEQAHDGFEHAPPPVLSDSAFAMELEALTEQGGIYGRPADEDLPVELESQDPNAAEEAGFGYQAADEEAALEATTRDTEPELEIDAGWSEMIESEANWSADADAIPDERSFDAQAPVAPQVPRPEDPSGDSPAGDLEPAEQGVVAASTRDSDLGLGKQAPAMPWRMEQAFLGNMQRLGGDQGSLSTSGSAPRVARPPVERPADRWNEQPGAAGAAEQRSVPEAQEEPVVGQRAVGADSVTSGPTDADQPNRPRKVGFAGAVTELESPVAAGAATPFSSRPVAGGATPVLDPSAVMPDEFAFVAAPAAPTVSAQPAGASLPGDGSPAVLDPDDDPLGDNVWSRLPPSTQDPGPGASGNGHPLTSPGAQDRIDEFLNLVRGGVHSNATLAQADAHKVNGHGGGPPTGDAGPAVPAASKPRGSIRGQTQIPDALEADDQVSPGRAAAAARSGLLWRISLLIALAFMAAAGVGAGIWYGLQPNVTVTMKLRYDIPESLSNDSQTAYRRAQLDALLEDSLRQHAQNLLEVGASGTEPDFLADLASYNRFALTAGWSDAEPNTLLLRRDASLSQRAAESARLKAVATALYDRGGTDRAARQRYGNELQQLEAELERSLQQLEEVTRQIEEAVARLPLPRDAASDVAQEQQLEERVAKLDEQWSAASRRILQIREQELSLQKADPYADDRQLAELNRQLTDIEAQMALFRRRTPDGDEPAASAEETRQQERGLLLEFPAALLFDDSLLDETLAQPAAQLQAANPGPLPEPPLDAGSRASGGPLQEQAKALLAHADTAAESLDPQQAQHLKTEAAAFAATVAHLLDKTLPAQVRTAGEVELLRQALLRTRRQRSVAMLDADEGIRTLRAEAALKERELNAAISDGLSERAVGLRMALRLTRDRLSMRVDEVTARLGDDAKVAAARRSYEAALISGRDSLTAQRTQFENALAVHRAAVRTLAPAGAADGLARAMTDLETAAREQIDEHSARLPLLRDVWAADPEGADEADQPQSEAPAAGDQRAHEELSFVYLLTQEPPIPATQPSLEEQAADLRRQIEARHGELREEQAQKLAQLREQLAAAEAAAAKAQRAAQEARGQLAEMRSEQESAIRERQRVSQRRVEKVDLESAIAEKHRELERARVATGMLATPLPPADVDLVVPVAAADPRPRLLLVSMGVIAILTLMGLLFIVRSASNSVS